MRGGGGLWPCELELAGLGGRVRRPRGRRSVPARGSCRDSSFSSDAIPSAFQAPAAHPGQASADVRGGHRWRRRGGQSLSGRISREPQAQHQETGGGCLYRKGRPSASQ